MSKQRHSVLFAAAVAASACVQSAPVSAQEWPTRPVRIVVPNGPGGGTDIVSRILGQALSEVLGQPFVIENKPGAGTTLGANQVAKAEKDGHTALMMSNAHAVSGASYKTLPYHPVKDFQMVSMVGTVSLILVTAPNFPPKTVKELVDTAKANPGKYNFASVGAGTTQHFAGELFRVLSGTDIKHVPYRTTPAALTGLLGGEVHMTVELVPAVQGQIASGNLRALAVTSPERSASMPDLPTLQEAGVANYNVTSWYGLAMPGGTPTPIIDKLNKAMREVMARKAVQDQILKTGIVVKSSTPQELESHVAAEIKKWSDLMKAAGIAQE